MGGIDLCEQREAKTGGEGRSISVDRKAKTGGEGRLIAVRRPISVVGAIHLLAKRDKSGGISVSVSESLGGEWEQGNWGTGTERRGNWEGNENSEIVGGEWEQGNWGNWDREGRGLGTVKLLNGRGRFLLVNPWGDGSRGIGGLGPRGEGIGRGMGTVKLLGDFC